MTNAVSYFRAAAICKNKSSESLLSICRQQSAIETLTNEEKYTYCSCLFQFKSALDDTESASTNRTASGANYNLTHLDTISYSARSAGFNDPL